MAAKFRPLLSAYAWQAKRQEFNLNNAEIKRKQLQKILNANLKNQYLKNIHFSKCPLLTKTGQVHP